MLEYTCPIRVAYADTDQMGVVYHGNYARYFEIARTEMLRDRGLTYKSMEEKGVMMPLSELYIKYIRPARYDDLLGVKLFIREKPESRIRIDYQITGESGKLLTEGRVTLAFVSARTMRPCKAPDFFLERFASDFE